MKSPFQIRGFTHRQVNALKREGRRWIPRQSAPLLARAIILRYIADNNLLAIPAKLKIKRRSK